MRDLSAHKQLSWGHVYADPFRHQGHRHHAVHLRVPVHGDPGGHGRGGDQGRAAAGRHPAPDLQAHARRRALLLGLQPEQVRDRARLARSPGPRRGQEARSGRGRVRAQPGPGRAGAGRPGLRRYPRAETRHHLRRDLRLRRDRRTAGALRLRHHRPGDGRPVLERPGHLSPARTTTGATWPPAPTPPSPCSWP